MDEGLGRQIPIIIVDDIELIFVDRASQPIHHATRNASGQLRGLGLQDLCDINFFAHDGVVKIYLDKYRDSFLKKA